VKEENKEENVEKKEEEKKEDKKSNNSNENKDVEQINQILDSNRKITNEDLKDASILYLEGKECDLFNGEKIKINAFGMEGGKGRNDGVTIFGGNSDQAKDISNKYIDFVLNLKHKNNYPYIFYIFFEKKTK
jgi:hypothetical protein